MDERHLIERAREGDAAAERALYDGHVDRVYRLAYRLVGSDALAQDVTQDTFIRAFGRLGEFRGDSAFGSWLHAITVSVALNSRRQTTRRNERETTLDDALTTVSTRRTAEPDLKQRLAESIDALAPGYRAVFVMHDVEGYTHEEIGQTLGIQAGTSKAQLSRARAKLREALRDFAGEWVS